MTSWHLYNFIWNIAVFTSLHLPNSNQKYCITAMGNLFFSRCSTLMLDCSWLITIPNICETLFYFFTNHIQSFFFSNLFSEWEAKDVLRRFFLVSFSVSYILYSSEDEEDNIFFYIVKIYIRDTWAKWFTFRVITWWIATWRRWKYWLLT